MKETIGSMPLRRHIVHVSLGSQIDIYRVSVYSSDKEICEKSDTFYCRKDITFLEALILHHIT